MTTASTKPTVQIMSVTPKMASQWLDTNTHNRNIRQRLVESYARDMVAGDWQLTGESIKFSADGLLLDGQHRLLAVVMADVKVDMLIVRGVSATSQEVMDSGAKRQASDALHLRGLSSPALLAAISRIGLSIDTYGYAGVTAKGKRVQFTTTEIGNYIAEHPEIEGFASPAWKVAKNMDCPPSVIGYAMWRLFQVDADEANDFFEKASTSVGLDKDDPILAMIRRFAAARRNRENLRQAAALSIVFRTWNARRAGKTLTSIPVTSREGAVAIPEPK